jgi:hypothetical protein
VVPASLIFGREHVPPIIAEFLKLNKGIKCPLLLTNRIVNVKCENIRQCPHVLSCAANRRQSLSIARMQNRGERDAHFGLGRAASVSQWPIKSYFTSHF